MSDPMETLFPPFALRITCGPLSMRVLRESDFAEVFAAIERHGIYPDDGLMPFLAPWDKLGRDHGWRQSLGFYWSSFATFSPQKWTLLLRVEYDGRYVGQQDVMSASDFRALWSLETGSWLLSSEQGRGIGTLMRQVVCAFAIDELGAEEMVSGYIDRNDRSAGVSRKVGYADNGCRRIEGVDGGWRLERLVRLTADRLVRPPYPVEVEGADAFRAFIGLDATR